MESPNGGIQREIRQGKPFRSPNLEAILSLVRTVDVLKTFVGGLVRTHGITLQQYNVVRILQGSGDQGLATLEIRERMVERRPGITGLVDRLEEKGLVVRERDANDRRQVVCRVTSEASALLASLDVPVAAAEDAAMERLEPDELAQLIRSLDEIRLSVAEHAR